MNCPNLTFCFIQRNAECFLEDVGLGSCSMRFTEETKGLLLDLSLDNPQAKELNFFWNLEVALNPLELRCLFLVFSDFIINSGLSSRVSFS